MSEVHVRCEELAPRVGDLFANLSLIAGAINRAAADGIELLVLPELATSGYRLADEAEARRCAISGDGPELRSLAGIIPLHMTVILGFCELSHRSLFNSAAVLTRERVLSIYRKTHLWDTEISLFVQGDIAPPVVQTPVGRVGIMICYDLEFPEMPRSLALAGADLIVVPTNWPLLDRPRGQRAPEVVQAMAAARASRIAIACCDRSGDERGTTWTRGTTIVNAEGWPIGTRTDEATHAFVDAVLDTAISREISPRNDVLRDRRPALYHPSLTEAHNPEAP